MESGGGGELLPRPGPSSIIAKPGDGRGGWRAPLFIVAVGFFERIGFVGVSANLIMYLTGMLAMSTASAAAGVNAWSGTVQVLPLVADWRLGRYRTLLAAGVLYLLSLGMLTASSMLQTVSSPPSASPARLAFFYVALYLLALAQGFYGPCGEAFGADQFASSDGDPTAPAFRSSYFNWFHFSISWGYAFASAGLSYVQDNAGWTVGFGACWAAMVLCLAVFLLGTPAYRSKQHADGGPFAETVRAQVARVFRRKDDATRTQRLIAPKPEDRLVVKLLPIWLTSIVFAVIFSQVSTLFTKQVSTLDRRLGTGTGLAVPPAALQCLSNLTFIVMLPLYDRVIVPLARRLTGHPAGITMLQRIGTSMATSCVAMVVAAFVEARRLRVAGDAGLADLSYVAVPMSLWWMIPQYVLVGLAGVLGQVGLEEFFYDQVLDTLRSVGLALCLSIFGVGSYASGALVSGIDWATRSRGQSWFSDNLNRAHLDYFYWLLAGLAALEVAAFLHFANRYVYRNKGASC
uniref:Major facilitator superfamily (MFS) profile domain-containing protein n=3 Tax=Setaria italica TaxID=4555 RepID=K3XPC0_SETIT